MQKKKSTRSWLKFLRKQKETGIGIESIDDEIDYRSVLLVLTGTGYAYENYGGD